MTDHFAVCVCLATLYMSKRDERRKREEIAAEDSESVREKKETTSADKVFVDEL
jgi:hypothetical protein